MKEFVILLFGLIGGYCVCRFGKDNVEKLWKKIKFGIKNLWKKITHKDNNDNDDDDDTPIGIG